jgi:hypothetical protein
MGVKGKGEFCDEDPEIARVAMKREIPVVHESGSSACLARSVIAVSWRLGVDRLQRHPEDSSERNKKTAIPHMLARILVFFL